MLRTTPLTPEDQINVDKRREEYFFCNHRPNELNNNVSYELLSGTPLDLPKAVLFPFNLKTGQFNTDHYDPRMTQGRISKEEVDHELASIAKMMQEWNACQFYFKGCIMWSFIIALFTYVLLIPVICVVCIMRSKASAIRKIFNEMKSSIQTQINSINQKYGERNLYWNIGSGFPVVVELYKLPPSALRQLNAFDEGIYISNPRRRRVPYNANLIEVPPPQLLSGQDQPMQSPLDNTSAQDMFNSIPYQNPLSTQRLAAQGPLDETSNPLQYNSNPTQLQTQTVSIQSYGPNMYNTNANYQA